MMNCLSLWASRSHMPSADTDSFCCLFPNTSLILLSYSRDVSDPIGFTNTTKRTPTSPAAAKEGLRIDQIERPKPLQTMNSFDLFIVSKQNIDPAIRAMGSVSSMTAGIFSIDMVMTLKPSPSWAFVLTRRASSMAWMSVTVAVRPTMLASVQFRYRNPKYLNRMPKFAAVLITALRRGIGPDRRLCADARKAGPAGRRPVPAC